MHGTYYFRLWQRPIKASFLFLSLQNKYMRKLNTKIYFIIIFQIILKSHVSPYKNMGGYTDKTIFHIKRKGR